MILSLLRNFHTAISESSTLADRMRFRGKDLSSQSVGILGFGRIGKHVYNYLRSFNCRILCWDCDSSKLDDIDQCHRADSMFELLSKSSVLTIHANEQANHSPILGAAN